MSRKFIKQFNGGSQFDATVDDIESTVQAVACGDKDKSEMIRKNLAQGFYTKDIPLESNFSMIWSEGV